MTVFELALAWRAKGGVIGKEVIGKETVPPAELLSAAHLKQMQAVADSDVEMEY